MDKSWKLEKDLNYFLNIPEILTKWKAAVVKYDLDGKEEYFKQMMENSKNIYSDTKKIKAVTDNWKHIQCK